MPSLSRFIRAAVLFPILLSLVGLALAAPSAGITFITTFGTSDSCAFNDLDEAVDFLLTRDVDERILRLERGVFENVALSTTTAQLTLQGGFDSCDSAEPTPGARTILFGVEGGGNPVIRHQGLEHPSAGDPASLHLSQIELGQGFGGLDISSPARVILEDVLILDNAAPTGGGIFVDAVSEVVDLQLIRTSVNGNETLSESSSPDGGGIACVGSGGIVQIKSGSTIIGNQAVDGGMGGGIFLDGCFLLARGDVEINLNRANFGGGLAITGDGSARLQGDGEGEVSMELNRAEERDGVLDRVFGRGGGVYLDEESLLIVDSGRIANNRALPLFGPGGLGGGIYVQNAEVLTAEGSLSCELPCVSLSENDASRGAALFATDGAAVEIVRTVLDGNASESTILEAEDGGGASSQLFVTSSFVSRNAAPTLMRVRNSGTLRLTHTSVGGNLGVDQAVIANDLSSFSLKSSIVFEPSANFLFNFGDSVAVAADCALVSDDAFFAGRPTVQEEDPLFVDAVVGNLHLLDTSPAIDLCAPILGIDEDIDDQAMPIDQDVVPDDGTPADAGADEVPFITPVVPDVFSDDFETGDFTSWSLVVE